MSRPRKTSGPKRKTESRLSAGEQAWSLLARAQPEACAELAASTLQANAADARAAFCLARALHALDRTDVAERQLRDLACRPDGRVSALLARGVLALLEKDGAAEELLTEAARELTATDQPGEQVAREQLGRLAVRAGRTDEAVAVLTTSLELANLIDAPLAIARGHYLLGEALLDTGKLDDAATQLRRAAACAAELGLWRWQGDAEQRASHAYAWQSKDDEALTHRKRALEAYRTADDLAGQARSMHSIAMSQAQKGRLTQGASDLREAIALAERAGDEERCTQCAGDMGVIAYFIGDHEGALRQWSSAIEHAPVTMSSDWRGGILSNIGVIYTDMGRYEEALAHLEPALVAIRSSDKKAETRITEVIALNNLGRLLCAIGRTPEGLDHLQLSIERSRQAGFTVHEAYAQRYQGLAHFQCGEQEQAANALHAALRLADEAGFFGIQESTLADLALVERKRGHRERAFELSKQAVDVAEGVRRRSRGATSIQSSFFGSRGGLYAVAVELLYEMHLENPTAGFDRQAFELAQRAKARSFSDLLTETQVSLRSRADPTLRQREQAILDEVAGLLEREDIEATERDRQITALGSELDLLEARIRTEDPRYAELVYPRPASLDDVRRHVLRRDDLLLEFLLGDDASYLWAVTAEAIRFVQLPARAEIDRALVALLPLLRDYNLVGAEAGYLAAAARPLSHLLLGPVESEIEAARRCIIAPHDMLHYLPFEALLMPAAADRRFAHFSDMPFLVKEVDVLYTPSVGALARQEERTAAPRPERELLLIGDPMSRQSGETSVFARAVLGDRAGPVPHAAEEMAALQGLFGADDTRVLGGADATIAGLRAATDGADYRLVHFSTHGVFNEQQPRFSGLVLSPDGDADDGFLSIGEVFALDLDCDQVVLSSCSSALGENVRGEGLVGLSRGFLFAGARSIVSALWEVAGRETAHFMQDYYRALLDSPGRAHALAETKRRMIDGSGADAVPGEPASETARGAGETATGAGRLATGAGELATGADTAHPYFWSAFVLSGASR